MMLLAHAVGDDEGMCSLLQGWLGQYSLHVRLQCRSRCVTNQARKSGCNQQCTTMSMQQESTLNATPYHLHSAMVANANTATHSCEWNSRPSHLTCTANLQTTNTMEGRPFPTPHADVKNPALAAGYVMPPDRHGNPYCMLVA